MTDSNGCPSRKKQQIALQNSYQSIFRLLALLCILSLSQALCGQQLTDKLKKQVIDSVNFQLRDKYVFPELAEQMAKELSTKYARGEYHPIKDVNIFADSLRSHLYAISRDKHIGVAYNPSLATRLRSPAIEEDPVKKFNRINERARKVNYGFNAIEIMEGNIGYIKMGAFVPTQYGGKTASAAMQFVSNCDALIFDLRNNFGGDPTMIQLLISYLYSEEPVHLNNFYHRKSNITTQSWTLPYVDGTRMPNVPVFVVINEHTISAGEEFAYNLKHLGRAQLVGESTAGAANFGEEFIATDSFIVWVPTGQAINPITQSNWEGVGVAPDVKVDAGEALNVAHKMAIEAINP